MSKWLAMLFFFNKRTIFQYLPLDRKNSWFYNLRRIWLKAYLNFENRTQLCLTSFTCYLSCVNLNNCINSSDTSNLISISMNSVSSNNVSNNVFKNVSIFIDFFSFHYQLNWVRRSILASSDSSRFLINFNRFS
jgi:hypothetical protein